VKGADKLILATTLTARGGDLWHVLEELKEKNAIKKQTVERVVFNAITKTGSSGGHEATRATSTVSRRCLPGPPRARLSRRVQLVAGVVA